jgi:hypothetical protein
MMRIADLAADRAGARVADALHAKLLESIRGATVNGERMYEDAEDAEDADLETHTTEIIDRLKRREPFARPRIEDLQLKKFIQRFLHLPMRERTAHMRTYGPMCLWDVSKTKDFSFECSVRSERDAPFHSDLFWDTSAATCMIGTFNENQEFRGDLSTWDVSNVRNTSKMFCDTKVEDSGIGGWDVRSMLTATGMFEGATSLSRELDLSRWDVRNCTGLSRMFAGSSIADGGIGTWTLHRHANTFLMLEDAPFEGDLSGWPNTKRLMAVAPRFGAVAHWEHRTDHRTRDVFDVFV